MAPSRVTCMHWFCKSIPRLAVSNFVARNVIVYVCFKGKFSNLCFRLGCFSVLVVEEVLCARLHSMIRG